MKKSAGRELIVFVTAGSKREAKTIGTTVVTERLAACATVVGVVESIYWWKGKIQRSTETMLMIKTTGKSYQLLEQRILALHSYDVPEVIAVSIVHGSQTYLSWIKHETSK